MAERNTGVPADKRIELRMGVPTGAWLPGTDAVERAAVVGNIDRGNPGAIIGGAMIRGPGKYRFDTWTADQG